MKQKSTKIFFFLELNGGEVQLAFLKLHETFEVVDTEPSVKSNGSQRNFFWFLFSNDSVGLSPWPLEGHRLPCLFLLCLETPGRNILVQICVQCTSRFLRRQSQPSGNGSLLIPASNPERSLSGPSPANPPSLPGQRRESISGELSALISTVCLDLVVSVRRYFQASSLSWLPL